MLSKVQQKFEKEGAGPTQQNDIIDKMNKNRLGIIISGPKSAVEKDIN